MVTERKLDKYIGALTDAKNFENNMWKIQSESPDRVDSVIEETIRRYKNIYVQHEDRVRWINKKFSERKV